MSHQLKVISPGPRPPFGQVADHLWDVGCDVDSDGNSRSPDDREWTELTVILRSDTEQRVDVDPISNDPLVLRVHSSNQLLCYRAAEFIASVSGGGLDPA